MFKLLLLSAFLSVAYAAVAIGPLEPKPDKFKDQEGCYIGELDEVIPFQSSKPSETSCMEYRCNADNIQYVTCGAVAPLPPCSPCFLVEDETQPYPDCCAQEVCP